MDKQGLLMCGRYAASPNYFGYCGPRKSSNIIDHLKENIADSELSHIISEFETLYPYLQLIARENAINDPFDKRVVEAYWIGNSLLKNIKNNNYLAFLKEKLLIEKKLNKNSFKKIKIKILNNHFLGRQTSLLPHHTFHVFNIFKNISKDLNQRTLKTMEECRINWGVIQKSKIKRSFIVKTKHLIIKNNYLYLGEPMLREIKIDYKGKAFVRELREGERVGYHWGMICDLLTERQVKNLDFYTQKAINYHNL